MEMSSSKMNDNSDVNLGRSPSNFIESIIEDDLLNGVVDKIHTRFPPEPNGYLHIGHAKSICLNFGLAEKYNGVCNLRFDDTNPITEEDEYVQAIKEDLKWHLAEIKEMLGSKKSNLSKKDIELGTQIISTLTNNFNYMDNDELIMQFAKTIDNIKVEYPELF